MNSIFWFGVVLGFLANLVASQCWEFRSRYLNWKAAQRLIGAWVAYNIKGRIVDVTPMPGAGLTVVTSRRHWWSANSGLLDVCAQDISAEGKRDHDGHIVFDQAIPWLARRIYRYADSNEIAEQRLVIGADNDIVYVFPNPSVATLGDVYGKHVWRRKGSVSDPDGQLFQAERGA